MQQLAFKDPAGRIHLMSESEALPPLARGYQWTMVVQPTCVMDEEPEPDAGPDTAQEPVGGHSPAGVLDLVMPLLTPREDQTPQERAKELIDSIPADVRGKLSQLFRALVPARPVELPPFPGVRR